MKMLIVGFLAGVATTVLALLLWDYLSAWLGKIGKKR